MFIIAIHTDKLQMFYCQPLAAILQAKASPKVLANTGDCNFNTRVDSPQNRGGGGGGVIELESTVFF